MSAVDFSNVDIELRTLEALSTDDEFRNAITKRLSNLRLICPLRIHTLVAAVASTKGYHINHKTLRGSHEDLFRSIWEFLDTTRVSSSGALRSVLMQALEGRSTTDYQRAMGISSKSAGCINDDVVMPNSNMWIKVNVKPHQSFKTIVDMCITDEVSSSQISHINGDDLHSRIFTGH